MRTELERIAAKARRETKLKFTSLCHHITKELVWDSLNGMSMTTAPGADGISVRRAKEDFDNWIGEMLRAVHHKGYHAPVVKRTWIPKPGRKGKFRPLGIPNVADRALQRSVSLVLTSIYEQDFLSCSFGGRPKLGAHNALATLNEVITGKKVNWVLEADIKNYFGSIDHGWLMQFVEHRVGDPRIINLIRRWLKAGILEDGKVYVNEVGTPQGGPISVLLSNIYMHYVLDLWFNEVVKPRLKGEAYLVRYIDDFLVCFQYYEDAQKFQEVLVKRLGKFGLELEPEKTGLVEFGRFAQERTKGKGMKMKSVYFLGFTHYCSVNRNGKLKLGRKTERTRFKRSVQNLYTLMLDIRHYSLEDQVKAINRVLVGHYAYYGIGGNYRSLNKLYRLVRRLWRKALSSRSQKSYVNWEAFERIVERFPIQPPMIRLSYEAMESMVVL
jgi:group II intron reverse transcriptase/maturase